MQPLPPNMAEKHVDSAQREQALRFLQMMAGKGGATAHQPILKSLKDIGVKIRKMTVMIDDKPEECIVVPLQELMSKEWAHINEMTEEQA